MRLTTLGTLVVSVLLLLLAWTLLGPAVTGSGAFRSLSRYRWTPVDWMVLIALAMAALSLLPRNPPPPAPELVPRADDRRPPWKER